MATTRCRSHSALSIQSRFSEQGKLTRILARMGRHAAVISPFNVINRTHGRVVLDGRNLSCGGSLKALLQFLYLLSQGGDAAVLLVDGVAHGLSLVLLLLERHLSALKFSLGVITLGSNPGEASCLLVAVHTQRVVLALVILGHSADGGELLLEAVNQVTGLNAAPVLHVGVLLSSLFKLLDVLLQGLLLLIEDDVGLAQLVELRRTLAQVDDLLPER